MKFRYNLIKPTTIYPVLEMILLFEGCTISQIGKLLSKHTKITLSYTATYHVVHKLVSLHVLKIIQKGKCKHVYKDSRFDELYISTKTYTQLFAEDIV